MDYLWATLLVLVNAVWWFLNLLVLPGNTLMVLSAGLVTWVTWDPGKGWNQQMFSKDVTGMNLLRADGPICIGVIICGPIIVMLKW